MGLFDNIMNKFRPADNDEGYLDDEYFDDYEDQNYQDEKKDSKLSGLFGRREAKVIDGGVSQGMQVVTVKPAGLEECTVICDHLLDGKTVILNMEGISTEIAQRIIDFSLGAIYAINGNLQMVSKYIFVATPMNVELSGDFMGDFAAKAMQTPSQKQHMPADNGGFRFNG